MGPKSMGTRRRPYAIVSSALGGSDVGMYLRTTGRYRKDGSQVRYVQLAHNRRVNGVTQAEVLLNLGREDQLDVDGLRRLAASITRFHRRRRRRDAAAGRAGRVRRDRVAGVGRGVAA